MKRQCPLFKTYQELQGGDIRALNLSELRASSDCTGCKLMKLALPPVPETDL